MNAEITLSTMASDGGTKTIPREMVERVCRILRERLDAEFHRKYGWQGKAAERTGISQSQINEMDNIHSHPAKGIGVPVLLKVRDYTGLSIDYLLGLPALEDPTQLSPMDAKIGDAAAKFEAALQRRIDDVMHQAELRANAPLTAAPKSAQSEFVAVDDRMNDNLRAILARRPVNPVVRERLMKDAAGKGANYSEMDWNEKIDEYENPSSVPPDTVIGDDHAGRVKAARAKAKKKRADRSVGEK